MDNKIPQKNSVDKIHNLSLEKRNVLNLSGIKEIGSFNEEVIVVKLYDYDLIIRGSGMRIDKMSVETGELIIKGLINSFEYSQAKENGNFFSRIFR